MDYEQEQEEEREVLLSIYEEDERFTKIDDKTFQYKFGEDGHFKSFVLEIKWTSDYPENAPNVNLDAFYNKHICHEVKESIVSKLMEQCEMNLGCAVTFTLIDWTNEHFDELTENQTEAVLQQSVSSLYSFIQIYTYTYVALILSSVKFVILTLTMEDWWPFWEYFYKESIINKDEPTTIC